MKDDDSVTALIEKFDVHVHWNLSEDADLIMGTREWVIFFDENEEVDWEISEKRDAEILEKCGSKTGAFYNSAAALFSLPVDDISSKNKKYFYRMVGEGLARAFDFDTDSAQSLFEEARKFATARREEVARFWFLRARVRTH